MARTLAGLRVGVVAVLLAALNQTIIATAPTTRNDPRGLRIVALLDLGWEMTPGDPNAVEESSVPQIRDLFMVESPRVRAHLLPSPSAAGIAAAVRCP